MRIIRNIQNRIYVIRGQRVMLDKDLAVLYEIATKRLTEAVKRNMPRFPEDFMFQLTKEEYESILPEVEHLDEADDSLRSQIATLKNGRGRHTKYLPYVFTEQGIAMLSGLINTEKAIQMNIAIMRAFVEIRRFLLDEKDLSLQLRKLREEVKERLGEHDVQLSQIYDAIENLLDEKVAEKKWSERQRIGFKTG